jgi:hypothetical protein
MRLYIRSRVNGPRCPEYEFARGSEAALYWNSKSWVEQVCRTIAQEGITVAMPFSSDRQSCSDFQVELRPLGGFVISCDVPVSQS